jgi:hypothetical protein
VRGESAVAKTIVARVELMRQCWDFLCGRVEQKGGRRMPPATLRLIEGSSELVAWVTPVIDRNIQRD